MYEYKMIQVPPNIEVNSKKHKGNEAAVYLEQIVNAQARDGWEFHRVDEIGVSVSPGCIAAFLGQKSQLSLYYVISFRRPTGDA
ncbi:DUF4177 domain-containing protein [Alcaligenaceae bacterium SJ-26]|nr:DUF4177 domain-containing protein [Alcaligenaceae bacterium SJ-26]